MVVNTAGRAFLYMYMTSACRGEVLCQQCLFTFHNVRRKHHNVTLSLFYVARSALVKSSMDVGESGFIAHDGTLH